MRRPVDGTLVFAVGALLSLGVVMVYSSSAVRALVEYQDSFYFLKRQAIWASLGLVSMMVMSRIDTRRLQVLCRPAFVATLVALVLVLIPGVGQVAHGSRRWLGWGSLSFQPSEAMKLAFVLYLADFLARRGEEGARRLVRGLVPPLAMLALCFMLILSQPDLGTAVCLAGTAFLMLFGGGASLLHLGLLGLASAPAMAWAVMGETYRRERFLAFLNPWADPQGSGYHIIQALYALGSGGLLGVGLGQSRQKFFYLPEQHTDFIFAIVGEELGFVGAIVVLGLFLVFAWRGYRAAVAPPDRFSSLLAMGITTMISLQALINIAVITSVLPITGIPLPFLSFGGSSLLVTLTGVGMLLSASRGLQGV
ncbi:MAG: putative lipid II flippase FtsW [Acetobacteraceae bacterium]|nr:putative lipid II flippase FtsW [Acetobacteraceae bacterium]